MSKRIDTRRTGEIMQAAMRELKVAGEPVPSSTLLNQG